MMYRYWFRTSITIRFIDIHSIHLKRPQNHRLVGFSIRKKHPQNFASSIYGTPHQLEVLSLGPDAMGTKILTFFSIQWVVLAPHLGNWAIPGNPWEILPQALCLSVYNPHSHPLTTVGSIINHSEIVIMFTNLAIK